VAVTSSNATLLVLGSCVAGCVLGAGAGACEPAVAVGARLCTTSLGEGGAMPNPGQPVTVPWKTGFEDGFCEYAQPQGFCFATGSASYDLVTSPVHSGRYAAAFSVRGDVDGGSQVRCVQQGAFPSAAYYGAWYYIPEFAQNSGNWNLVHFQGGDGGGQTLHNVWDVSLVNLSDGGLRVNLKDYLTDVSPDAAAIPPMPIGQWVHLEVYFKRAKGTTGEISMWQDGVQVADLDGVVTDDSDWGQWYVGNLVSALAPPASTVYVDDVEISLVP
jgi:hypothetical protein